MSSFQLQSVPELFKCEDTGSPFSKCLVCENELSDTQYLVEKSFINYPGMNTRDLVWEYALCLDCVEDLKKEYSEESNRRLSQFFMQNMNLSKLKKLEDEGTFDAEEWTASCVVTGKSRSECNQFQVYGYFIGDFMFYGNGPFMISDEAMDMAIPLISDKTLGFMNDFRDRHFPPPEDLSPLFPERDFVLI